MAEVEETVLPGVGVRYSFTTMAGRRVSVVHHHSGRHELFISDADDTDAARQVLELDDEDSRILAELLGTSRVVREIGRLQQEVAGLAIEWLPVGPDGPAAGASVGELEVRSRTGVTVVAALRRGVALPVPGPSFVIEADDTLVVVGAPEDIREADVLLRG